MEVFKACNADNAKLEFHRRRDRAKRALKLLALLRLITSAVHDSRSAEIVLQVVGDTLLLADRGAERGVEAATTLL